MTINCLGNLIDLEMPRVMGILNVSPDSFYDGGRYSSSDEVLKQAGRMLDEGATFIDVGAYSSRPGASDISEAEEKSRLLPVVDMLLEAYPGIVLSVDTFRSGVAGSCLERGVGMINDISGGDMDGNMLPTIAQFQAPFVAMHMKGNPRNMEELTSYDDLLGEVLYSFSEKLARARALGIKDCILDPGFGFAKSREQNYELLAYLDELAVFGHPLLIGISRKSMIYKLLGLGPDKALNGTTALHMVALGKGANILRVHDVREAMECIRLKQALDKKYWEGGP